MNYSKTEFILVGSQKQLKKCVTESIDIVGETVNRSVSKKCATAALNFLRIKSIRQYLTQEAAETPCTHTQDFPY